MATGRSDSADHLRERSEQVWMTPAAAAAVRRGYPAHGAAASRFELLAAAVVAEGDRAGEPIGYQHTMVEILRTLDDHERGRLTMQQCMDLVAAHIAEAVVVDPFEQHSVAG